MTGPATGPSNGSERHQIDPKSRWYNRKSIAYNSWIILLLITSSATGYADSMMNVLQLLPQWKQAFGYPTGGKLGLFNAIQHVGTLTGHLLAPYISDGIGRRYTILLGASIMIVATAIQMGASSTGMFIGAQLLVGVGLAFSTNTAPVLVAELVYPTYREFMTSIFHSLWYTGAILAAWVTFGSSMLKSSWAWRIPSVFQAFPSILQVSFVLLVPESPRWLVIKGKYVEALKTLAYYHADGNENDPLVKYEFGEIQAAILLESTDTPNAGWASLLSNPGDKRRLCIIIAIAVFSQWSGNSLFSYHISKVLDIIGVVDPTIQLLVNGNLQVWNLFWALLASAFAEHLGHRFLFLSSACGMLVFMTLQIVFMSLFMQNGSSPVAHAVIALIFLFSAFYDIAFTPLIMTYTIKMLPHRFRAERFNIFNLTIQVALITNKFISPIALDRWGWRYYIIYICCLSSEVVFIWFFIVETSNMTPDETAAVSDGDVALEQDAARFGRLRHLINSQPSEQLQHYSYSSIKVARGMDQALS